MPHEQTPLIVAFVSGKGGVGKTMLAVALAKEMSIQLKTLVIDLDFFNRGLTGLMRFGRRVCSLDPPSFLVSQGQSDWWLTEVADNLYHISYPDLQAGDMQRFETLSVETLRDSLRDFVLLAARACSCTCVVLDCHGGPDNSSFAACLLADNVLLISEPDRITFYGTLNFIRQLARLSKGCSVDLRLVFNKVVPAFSGLYLLRFYNDAVRQELGDHPLLAIYPLEVYLTKEFERTPFLTAAYPASLLARKTRTLLYELFITNHPDVLAKGIRFVPKWVRTYRKLTLGKKFFLVDLDFITATIVAVLLIISGIFLLEENVLAKRTDSPVAAIQRLELLAFANADVLKLAEVQKYLSGELSARSLVDLRQVKDIPGGDPNFYAYMWLSKLSYESVVRASASEAPPGFSAYPSPLWEEWSGSRRQFFLKRRSFWLRNSGFRLALADNRLEAVRARNLNILRNASLPAMAIEASVGWVEYSADNLFLAALFWFGAALLLNWSISLDRRFVYYCSQRRYGRATTWFFAAVLLWIAPTLLVGTAVARRESTGLALFLEWTTILIFVLALAELIWILYRNSIYERKVFDPAARFAFVVLLGLVLVVGYRHPLF